MVHIPAIEIVQTFFALIGIILSARAVAYAYLTERDNLHENFNGSGGIVARIRSRRTREFLFLHCVGFASGLYVIGWRLQHPEVSHFAPTITRNATIIVFQFVMMRSTIKDLFDRRDVAEIQRLEREQAAKLANRRSTDAPRDVPPDLT